MYVIPLFVSPQRFEPNGLNYFFVSDLVSELVSYNIWQVFLSTLCILPRKSDQAFYDLIDVPAKGSNILHRGLLSLLFSSRRLISFNKQTGSNPRTRPPSIDNTLITFFPHLSVVKRKVPIIVNSG